jgi:hypothetical protein
VRLAQTLLDRKRRVYGTGRAKRGIPCDLEGEGMRLEKGSQHFGGMVTLRCECGGTRLVHMIGMSHDEAVVNKGRKDRKTNMDIEKPYAAVQYSKFIKGIDRADQYLSYYLALKKTVKWSKKVALYLLNCMLFKPLFCVQDNKYEQSKYKNFLHEVGRSWASVVQNLSESSSDDLHLPEKGSEQYPPGRIHKVEKIGSGGEGKMKCPARQCTVCVRYTRNEVKLETFVNSTLFCFTKGLVLRSTVQ